MKHQKLDVWILGITYMIYVYSIELVVHDCISISSFQFITYMIYVYSIA